MRQLTLAERGRAGRERRALEQDDPLGSRLDRAEPQLRERRPLVGVEAVAVGREAVAPELPLDERVRREHSEAVHDEDHRHRDRDEHRDSPRREARPARCAGQSG